MIATAPAFRAEDPRDWSDIRGFNYQPSYGRSGLDTWIGFDADVVATELARGREYFPGINSIRIWLSWEAFKFDPERFARSFDTFVDLIDDIGCSAMPVLFNRWRGFPDFGGIYLDHFVPGQLGRPDDGVIDAYLETVVGRHASDSRILAWDLCNEPFFDESALGGGPDVIGRYGVTPQVVRDAEVGWLRSIRDRVRALAPSQPLTIAAHGDAVTAPLSRVDEFSDVLTIHPYWIPGVYESLEEFTAGVDVHVAFAREVGKPLVASECCMGRDDDAERVQIIRGTLEVLKSRGVGWMPHLLHYSGVADAHRAPYAPLYMAFIEADGSLRPGHDVYNEF